MRRRIEIGCNQYKMYSFEMQAKFKKFYIENPTHRLFLYEIEAGDLLDEVKLEVVPDHNPASLYK